MSILAGLLLALVPLPALPAPAPAPAPEEIAQERQSEERVKAAAEAITRALNRNKRVPVETRIEVLLEHGWIDDERVIAPVAMGLYDKKMSVKVVAVELLGGMQSDASIVPLIKFFQKRHPKLKLEVELWPRIFRAVGRRGKQFAIPTLLTNVRGQMAEGTLRARLFALANIRTVESVEGVFTVLEELDETHRELATEDARLALFILTGEVLEGDAAALDEWWQGVYLDLVLPPAAPRLEGQAWEAWREFWQLPEREARPADDSGDQGPR